MPLASIPGLRTIYLTSSAAAPSTLTSAFFPKSARQSYRKRIAHFYGTEGSVNDERLEGYRDALASAGILSASRNM
ncbi:MAG: hypothetical protein PHV82_11915 [Victivallaceae bacterium]|nr:hypothetical protein [Victivallaceae bacterium]